jgi:hypothetical protein
MPIADGHEQQGARSRERLDAQRERVEASDDPIPYAGRAHEPGQQVAGDDPALHTGRGESVDMAVSRATAARAASRSEPPPASDTADEAYQVAAPAARMLTTEEKLGLDHGAPGAIRDPASPGVGPISNFLFILIAALVVFAIVYLLYQNL